MRIVMFKERFAEPVRSGSKRQTIRKRAGCAVGDILSLRRWTGRPRHSKQELLREAPCRSVKTIEISMADVRVQGVRVHEESMAQADGFIDCKEMREWFGRVHGLPFRGFLIEW